MMKWLVLVAAAFVLYKLITNEKKAKTGAEDTSRDRRIATGELVKDPVCGVYVESQDSISVRDGDTIHRFCSYECRQAFLDRLSGQGREIPIIKNDQGE